MYRKFLISFFVALAIMPVFTLGVSAQTDGAMLFNDLRSGQVSCSSLGDEQYKALGTFFMQRMAGSAFNTMDTRIDSMMGATNTDAMYITLGKRLSGCDVNAPYPAVRDNLAGYLSNYGAMMGPSYFGMGYMMQNFTGWGGIYQLLAVLILLAFFIALVLAIIYLFKKISKP